MANYKSEQLNATFGALSDPTRRAIIARLAKGEAQVSELAEPFGMSLPAVSKHLRVLENANLITRRVDGRVHKLSINPKPLQTAQSWIEFYENFWKEQLNSLDDYLKKSIAKKTGKTKSKEKK